MNLMVLLKVFYLTLCDSYKHGFLMFIRGLNRVQSLKQTQTAPANFAEFLRGL